MIDPKYNLPESNPESKYNTLLETEMTKRAHDAERERRKFEKEMTKRAHDAEYCRRKFEKEMTKRAHDAERERRIIPGDEWDSAEMQHRQAIKHVPVDLTPIRKLDDLR